MSAYQPKPPENEGNVRIVQFSDEEKTLPDGSKMIYAESDSKIVMYHKKKLEHANTYVFDRETGDIYLNNKKGTNEDKRKMIALGRYFISHCRESDLVTITVRNK